MPNEMAQKQQTALLGTLRDFRSPEGGNLLARLSSFHQWQQERIDQHLWNGDKSAAAKDDFTSRDHLGLSKVTHLREVVADAVQSYGISPGNSASLEAEVTQSLSDWFGGGDSLLFQSGWVAAYSAVQCLVGPNDHVMLDVATRPALQEGAKSSTQNLHYFPHLSVDALAYKLERLRLRDQRNGILVAIETLYADHATSPDLPAIRALCKEFNATLLLECTNDLGSAGLSGLGLASDERINSADLLVGDLSHTFSTEGGFIATRSAPAAAYLRAFGASLTTGPSAPALVAARGALKIIQSEDGEGLRRDLAGKSEQLVGLLEAQEFDVFGKSPQMVLVKAGPVAFARLFARRVAALGHFVEFLEGVPGAKGAAIVRLMVSARHTNLQLQEIVEILVKARQRAEREAELLGLSYRKERSAADRANSSSRRNAA